MIINVNGKVVETFTIKTHDKTLCQWLTSGRQSVVRSASKLPVLTDLEKQNIDASARLFELTKKAEQCLLTFIQLLEKLPVLSEINALDNNKQADQQRIYTALKMAVIGLEKITTHEIKPSDNTLTETVISVTRLRTAELRTEREYERSSRTHLAPKCIYFVTN